MDININKQNIYTGLNSKSVSIVVEQTLEDNIEDGVQTGTHYIFITDEWGNTITIEDGMIKHGNFNGEEIYIDEGNLTN
jgi:hypothetical protein